MNKYLDPTITDGFQTKKDTLNFLKTKDSLIKNDLGFNIIKDGNTPIGKLDFNLIDNSIYPGYWLGKDFQGKGYMSEACLELCNKVFNASDVKILYIACDFKNQNSINLAKKIFFYIKKNNNTINLSQSIDSCAHKFIFNGKHLSYNYMQLILQKI